MAYDTGPGLDMKNHVLFADGRIESMPIRDILNQVDQTEQRHAAMTQVPNPGAAGFQPPAWANQPPTPTPYTPPMPVRPPGPMPPRPGEYTSVPPGVVPPNPIPVNPAPATQPAGVYAWTALRPSEAGMARVQHNLRNLYSDLLRLRQ